MHRFVILAVMGLSPFRVLAQEYHPFRAAFGLGGTYGLGVIIYFEPSVRLTDKFSVGYRSEGGAFFSDDASYRLSSKGGVVQYYFLERDVRLFVGCGLANYTYQPDEYHWVNTSSFGFFPRIGYDDNHLTVCFDFNIIDDFAVATSPNSIQNEMTNRSYVSLRFGAVIGGGKKKQPNNKLQ